MTRPHQPASRPTRKALPAFTMTELLVSMGILAMVLVLTTSMVTHTQKTLRSARSSAASVRWTARTPRMK